MSQTNTTHRQWILPLYGLLLMGLLWGWWRLPDGISLLTAAENRSVITKFETAVLDNPVYLLLRPRTPVRLSDQVSAVATDRTLPAAPLNLLSIDQKIGQTITLTWEPALGEEYIGYNVYRAAVATDPGKLLASLVTATTYTDTTADTGTTYTYTVEGVVRNGSQSVASVRSNVATTTATDSTPPHAPTKVLAENTQDGLAIRVTWINPPDQDFSVVRLYRSAVFGETGTLLADQVVGEEYVDTQVPANNTEVFYSVTSVDTAGNESPKALRTLPPGNPNPFQVLYQ